MKSYIVPGLDDTDKLLLHNNGMVFYQWDAENIIINESQLPQLLELLDATASEAATEYENMYMLTLQFNMTAGSNNGGNRAADRARLQSRAKYIQACSARLTAVLNEATAKVEDRKKKLGPAQEAFVSSARYSYIASNKKSEEELAREFAEQFERLKAVPKVRAVRVTNGAILVYTETLYATDPATKLRHELGAYLIIINTDGSQDGVRWFNTTRRVRTIQTGMNAPRVYADGHACVDEIKETLLELIAQFEFATVAELAIQFVETLTDDELSKQVNKWPLA